MIEKIRYVNHLGQTIEFGIRNLFSNQNDLRDYKWGYNTRNKVAYQPES